MVHKQKQEKMSRRDFLKLSAAAGAAAAGGHLLNTYAPWLNYEAKVEDGMQPLETLKDVNAQMQEIVRYATLAANGHNTQPWYFQIREHSIRIQPDPARRLMVVDPEDRAMWISLGCALENLVIAARAAGYAADIRYPENSESIEVYLATDTARTGALFEAIPQRQNTRSVYDGRKLAASELKALQALPLESNVSLLFVTDTTGMETLADFVRRGNLAQYADAAFVDELIFWLRFNKKEAFKLQDGLYSRCSGNPEVPRWLGSMFVSSSKPEQMAGADVEKLRSSAGAVIISSEGEDRTAWVKTGQVYQRLALQMTALGIRSAFLNQPIEVSGLRPELQNALGLGASWPQLLVRFGYADEMPRSLRRPVSDVLV